MQFYYIKSFYSNEKTTKSYLGGVRLIKSNIILSIINVSQKEIREWAEVIEEFKIGYIFIDIEKNFHLNLILIEKLKKRI